MCIAYWGAASTHIQWDQHRSRINLNQQFYLFLSGATLNTTTMGWGSRQAPLFSVWWKTSNIWPWGSSPSHRNRGTHIKTPLHTAAMAVNHYKTLFCSCLPSEYIYLISIIITFKMQYLTENTLIVETCMIWLRRISMLFPFLSSLCSPELSCMLSNLQFIVKSPIVSCKKMVAS